jgi:hypothetical protein
MRLFGDYGFVLLSSTAPEDVPGAGTFTVEDIVAVRIRIICLSKSNLECSHCYWLMHWFHTGPYDEERINGTPSHSGNGFRSEIHWFNNVSLCYWIKFQGESSLWSSAVILNKLNRCDRSSKVETKKWQEDFFKYFKDVSLLVRKWFVTCSRWNWDRGMNSLVLLT